MMMNDDADESGNNNQEVAMNESLESDLNSNKIAANYKEGMDGEKDQTKKIIIKNILFYFCL